MAEEAKLDETNETPDISQERLEKSPLKIFQDEFHKKDKEKDSDEANCCGYSI